jgi:hypothetical protein
LSQTITDKLLALRNEYPIEAVIHPQTGTFFKLNEGLHQALNKINYHLDEEMGYWHASYNNDPVEIHQLSTMNVDSDVYLKLDYTWQNY